MGEIKLVLELMNGPLDGHVVTLDDQAFWGAAVEGQLAFPWDGELGERQARFSYEAGHWWLEGAQAAHGTYRVNRQQPERVETRIRLEAGDILRASNTWLLVREMIDA